MTKNAALGLPFPPVLAGLALLSLNLTGCAPTPVARSGSGEEALRLAQAAQVAKSRVGAPYRFGEEGPTAFDCSGLVYFAYRRVGLQVPRTVRKLRQRARRIDPDRLRPGDLLFFRLSGKLAHVAIYVGEDRFVHAPKSGDRVSYSNLGNPFWREHLASAGRVY